MAPHHVKISSLAWCDDGHPHGLKGRAGSGSDLDTNEGARCGAAKAVGLWTISVTLLKQLRCERFGDAQNTGGARKSRSDYNCLGIGVASASTWGLNPRKSEGKIGVLEKVSRSSRKRRRISGKGCNACGFDRGLREPPPRSTIPP